MAREPGPIGPQGKLSDSYPPRFNVPSEYVSWCVRWPASLGEYQPIEFTAEQVLNASRDRNPDLPLSAQSDPHDILTATHSLAHEDPSKANKTFSDELREDRRTFEGEITFCPERSREPGAAVQAGRPLNPRGRTGMTGRGMLRKWGANQACDSIVTRYHPREKKLQFLARLAEQRHVWVESLGRPSGLDRTGELAELANALLKGANEVRPKQHEFTDEEHAKLCQVSADAKASSPPRPNDYVVIGPKYFVLHPPKRVWGVQGGMLRPGETPKKRAQLVMKERVLEKASALERPAQEHERLEVLIEELFSSVEKNVVYTGYVDDYRNTDNAWIETTVLHFHCSRELGGMLALGVGAGVDDLLEGDLMWVSASERDPWERGIVLFGNHREFIERVAREMHNVPQRGLLLNAVTWGNKEWVEHVLRDTVLVEHRTHAAMQAAFQMALKRASDPSRFDLRILDMLVHHGAIPADVFVTDLFEGGGDGVHDAFGHLRALNTALKEGRSEKSAWEGQRDWGGGMQSVQQKPGDAQVHSRSGSQQKPGDAQGDVHATTPWRREHSRLMGRYVEGH